MIPKALDGARRRRIHLLRHAEAAYFDAAGKRTGDSRIVSLTPKGREQAAAMRDLLKDVDLDGVVISGLPRTVETAEIVAEGRNLPVRLEPQLEEIRGENALEIARDRILPDIAYAFWKARAEGTDGGYRNGERFDGFFARCRAGIEAVLKQEDWTSLLLVAHGGVNRAVLCWALGAGLHSFPVFEQDSCCLNIIDIDTDEGGNVIRMYIRAVNITPYDFPKRKHHATTLEGMAQRYLVQTPS